MTTANDTRGNGTLPRRILEWARMVGGDVAVGLLWAALIVAVVLFSGIATQFAYVDF